MQQQFSELKLLDYYAIYVLFYNRLALCYTELFKKSGSVGNYEKAEQYFQSSMLADYSTLNVAGY